MLTPPLTYFTDAVLRAPTIGCMLMCLSASLVGVIAFLRKQSLVGESLSHASFPGVILGLAAANQLSNGNESWIWFPLITMLGAFSSAFLGLWIIHYLEKKKRIRSDSALCFILSIFFGIGITLASRIQFTNTAIYNQSLNYFYGQAATMIDIHIFIYGTLSLIIIAVLLLFYKELQILIFDRDYAISLGIRVSFIETLIFVLLTSAIVIGIRSVGVVLMSAMLIAPAAAARQFTHRLWIMLLLSAFFGLLSGYFGVYLSVELSNYFSTQNTRLSFPTGPMIVMVATFLCVFALLFSPERGLIVRLLRITFFKFQCIGENILKAMWREDPEKTYSFKDIANFQHVSKLYLTLILFKLTKQGWIKKITSNTYKLTKEGARHAAYIVRLHRLWELYLADHLGIGAERVHRSAEEMEHIITPDLEIRLTELLEDPKYDPHQQPIPPYKKGT